MFGIESKIKRMGWTKIEENSSLCCYRKEASFYYTKRLDIYKKASGNHIINCYEESLNSDGFNNSVGMTQEEMRIFARKMRQMIRKYKWNSPIKRK